MSTRREHRLVTVYPGAFLNERSSRPIDSWDVAAALAVVPKGAFAFRFTTVLVADPIDDGEGGTLDVKPKKVAQSGTYYPDGLVYTDAEIEAMGDETRILLSNMRSNDWPRVVKTRVGNWQPFVDGDEVVL